MTAPRQVTRRKAPVKEPLAAPGASYLAALIALLFVLAGVVLIREAALDAGWIAGTSWTTAALEFMDPLTPVPWMRWASVVTIAAGVAAVVITFLPRRKRSVRVDAESAVFVDLTEVSHIADLAAESVPGVLSARSAARRRRVTVRCVVIGDGDATKERIEAAVSGELATLATTPKITIRIRRKVRS